MSETKTKSDPLPYFLGPKSEQRALLKEILDLVTNDYIFWRRNYQPKDPPAIPYESLHSLEHGAYKSKLFQELFNLLADLKLDVPFFSPRYMAHISSETTLPSLIAYISTLLFNPNNVSIEASPVTLNYELQVGQQFAELFGFDPLSSFGHLTSGGTIANFEALWYHKTFTYLPLSLALACIKHGLPLPAQMPGDLWSLYNCNFVQTKAYYQDFCQSAQRAALDPGTILQAMTIGELGETDFHKAVADHFGQDVKVPVVILPESAHYSWKRAANLQGIGRSHLLSIPLDSQRRLKISELEKILDRCLKERRPILQLVTVLGTTEFGTVDPIEEICSMRNTMESRGLFFPIHVDAAFGGYFPTIFREAPDDVERDSRLLPLRKACEALKDVDSVTVDPHKMGFCPYGAGSIVFKHGFLKHFVSEKAPYVFDHQVQDAHGVNSLGPYILEGSKPGAAAASVYFSHRIIPLNYQGYGRLLHELINIAQNFHADLVQFNHDLQRRGKPYCFLPISAPDTNICTFIVVPQQETSLMRIDWFNQQLAQRFGVKDVTSIQEYDYLVSRTRLKAADLISTGNETLKLCAKDCESLTLLRLVFMNQWVAHQNSRGIPYSIDFLTSVERETDLLLKQNESPPPVRPV
jgi:glutamate/tyrosine decarboxylase-like PLP-dependent enzyme